MGRILLIIVLVLTPTLSDFALHQKTQEPDPLTSAKAEIEEIQESHSIEKTGRSVLKVRNCLPFQVPFDAPQSHDSFKQFHWPVFYEFRNPGDKDIVITDFRILWPGTSFQGKQLRLVDRSNPERVTVFDDLDRRYGSEGPSLRTVYQAINKETDERGLKKFPIRIPPHMARYVKLHFTFDLVSADKPLDFRDENEAYRWLMGAIGLRLDRGDFWCDFREVPIEVSTADRKILNYEPYTALLVPGCQLETPARLK